ncbi:MAG: glycosyltransferase, partial [Candidatus Andersenbacteria bacterium]
TFPSLYEGFGLPPLEAMAVGCPVIASNVSSFPEVLGEAALYVNPEYVPDIVDKIRKVLDKPELQRMLIQRGQVQARLTSWGDSAARYLHTYTT